MNKGDNQETKDGKRIWSGTTWVYYILINCLNCGEKVYVQKCNYKQQKNRAYCKNPLCKYNYNVKLRDFNAWNILNKLDTPEFNYLMGLIVTDGSILYPKCNKTAKCYQCRIELNKIDSSIINMIKNTFGGTIYDRSNKTNTFIWNLCYPDFIIYLRDIVGLTNTKTYNLDIKNWFNTLSEDNKNHFFRGVVDGDGCIYNYNNSRGVKITSASKKFIDLIDNYIKVPHYIIPIENAPLQKNPIWIIQVNGSYSVQWLDLLYNNAKNWKLDRKYNTYLQIKQHYS